MEENEEVKGFIFPYIIFMIVWLISIAIWAIAFIDFGGGTLAEISERLRYYCFGVNAEGSTGFIRTIGMIMTPLVVTIVVIVVWKRELFATFRKKAIFSVSAMIVLVCFVSTRIYANYSDSYSIDATINPRVQAFDFTMSNQKDEQFVLSNKQGKVVCMTFFYTKCTGTCPAQIGYLFSVQQEFKEKLGKDLLIVGVSMDPVRDDKFSMAKYARDHNLSHEGWELVYTPDREAIHKVLEEYQVVVDIPMQINPTTQIGHTPLITLLDKNGQQAYNFFGVDFPKDDLLDAVENLLDE